MSNPCGRPFKYPFLPGETKREYQLRINRETRYRKLGKECPPKGNFIYPLIEGESMAERRNRLSLEAKKRRQEAGVPEDVSSSLAKSRLTSRFKKYGITPEQYNSMFEEQGGLCKICKQPETAKTRRRLSVDHCHGKNKVRGLLCSLCNFGIGYLRDSPEILRSAIEYLEFSFDPEKDLVCV